MRLDTRSHLRWHIIEPQAAGCCNQAHSAVQMPQLRRATGSGTSTCLLRQAACRQYCMPPGPLRPGPRSCCSAAGRSPQKEHQLGTAGWKGSPVLLSSRAMSRSEIQAIHRSAIHQSTHPPDRGCHDLLCGGCAADPHLLDFRFERESHSRPLAARTGKHWSARPPLTADMVNLCT